MSFFIFPQLYLSQKGLSLFSVIIFTNKISYFIVYRVTVWLITQTVFLILYCPIFSENTFSLNLKLEFFNEKSLLILEFYQKSILDFDATIL